jgi:hypothetical protein
MKFWKECYKYYTTYQDFLIDDKERRIHAPIIIL